MILITWMINLLLSFLLFLLDSSPLSYGFMNFIHTFFYNEQKYLILAKRSTPSFLTNKNSYIQVGLLLIIFVLFQKTKNVVLAHSPKSQSQSQNLILSWSQSQSQTLRPRYQSLSLSLKI